MLLRTMRAHFLLLTQLYPHCGFDTPNLENYLHLSILIFFRGMCAHFMLLTQFYLH